MACDWTAHRAICSAVAAAPQASTHQPLDPVGVRDRPLQGPHPAHRPADDRGPPARYRAASASAASTATWSRIVTAGNREPQRATVRRGRGRTGRALAAAEHVGQTTHHRSVSIGAARTDQRVPPPGRRMPGSGRPGDVAVTGERVQRPARRCPSSASACPTSRRRPSRRPSSPPSSSRQRAIGEHVRERPAAGRSGRPPARRRRPAAARPGRGTVVTAQRGHALAARNPASRSAMMSSIVSSPTDRRTRSGRRRRSRPARPR